MQRQRIQEQLFAPSDIPFKREYYDMLTGTSPNRANYQQMLKLDVSLILAYIVLTVLVAIPLKG